jgi:SAM-dependent methyltransferase
LPANDLPYSRYARHYDQIGQSLFGLRSITRLLAILAQDQFVPATVLDLACGTGQVAIALAKQGLAITGLDQSPEMIQLAARAADRGGVSVNWQIANMTDFTAERTFDLCTCFYDAVNYLPSLEALGGFLNCSIDALRPGGWLAFDINTTRKLSEHWNDSVIIAADDRDRFLVYRSWYDDRSDSSPLQLTGFERRADGAWDRFDEEHVEYSFGIADVARALQKAGFVEIRPLDWGEGDPDQVRAGTEESLRVLFLAQKPEA